MRRSVVRNPGSLCSSSACSPSPTLPSSLHASRETAASSPERKDASALSRSDLSLDITGPKGRVREVVVLSKGRQSMGSSAVSPEVSVLASLNSLAFQRPTRARKRAMPEKDVSELLPLCGDSPDETSTFGRQSPRFPARNIVETSARIDAAERRQRNVVSATSEEV
jgi:hypothetical protein